MSSSSIAPFYTTDLEATTALVLDRSGFLDSVTDAVTYEDKDNNAAKMLSILATENSAFLSVFPALLTDVDVEIRNKAYLALGNLIASDNYAIAQVALKCAYNAVVNNKFVFTKETANGIAYVLTNMAMRFKQWPNVKEIPNIAVCAESPILLYAKTYLTADLPASVKRDMLWVFKKLKSSLLEPTFLINLLEQEEKKTFRIALHMLGEQVSDPLANYLIAQMLYLQMQDPTKDISIYINRMYKSNQSCSCYCSCNIII
jgi:hypothetical protein